MTQLNLPHNTEAYHEMVRNLACSGVNTVPATLAFVLRVFKERQRVTAQEPQREFTIDLWQEFNELSFQHYLKVVERAI